MRSKFGLFGPSDVCAYDTLAKLPDMSGSNDTASTPREICELQRQKQDVHEWET